MKITPEELRASYRRMPEDELLSLDRGELTEMARACYDQELLRRGLERKPEGVDRSAPGAPREEPFVVVDTCSSAEDAWEMQATLEAANIPARIGDPHVHDRQQPGLGTDRFPVAVPASFVEDARQLLNAQAPDAIIIAARYVNGAFQPLEDIAIQEGTVVEVHVPANGIL